MREITSHRVGPLNERLRIEAFDRPNIAECYEYRITGVDEREEKPRTWHLTFQGGPVETMGVNGISNEVLLAIVADRLQRDAGDGEGLEAWRKVREAMMWLQSPERGQIAQIKK